MVGIDQMPSEPCSVCGSTDWWYREPSYLGGKGEWVCGRCHPHPQSSTTININEKPDISEGFIQIEEEPIITRRKK